MTTGLRDKSVTSWMDIVDDGDFLHDYMVSFGAIIANVFNLIFPQWITEIILGALATGIFEGGTNHKQSTHEKHPPHWQRNFLIEEYLPRLFEETNGVNIPFTEKLDLLVKFTAVLFKIFYAFSF